MYFAMSLEITPTHTMKYNEAEDAMEDNIYGTHYVDIHPYGANYGYNSTDTVASSIFLQTLDDTNSPALAVQALLTKLSQTWYYTTLPLLYVQEEAEIASSAVTYLPTRVRGLLCASAILMGHLIVVFLTAVAFASGTQRSLIGNSWPAVAQINENLVVEGMVKRASDMRDADVRRWAKDNTAKENHVMRLRRRKL